MNDLPIEIFENIGQHMLVRDIANLSLVSKDLNFKTSIIKNKKIDEREFSLLLEREYGSNFPIFNEALIESGALIAGGSVCGAFHGFRSKDFDVYVNVSRARTFIEVIKRIGYKLNTLNMTSTYDASFMRKNKILTRFEFKLKGHRHIDLMILADSTKPQKVVTNFDLTFCEVWYDGTCVRATDAGEFLQKMGKLRDEYFGSYTRGNKFTINRIIKYMKRGFIITIVRPESYKQFVCENKPKRVCNCNHIHNMLNMSCIGQYEFCLLKDTDITDVVLKYLAHPNDEDLIELVIKCYRLFEYGDTLSLNDMINIYYDMYNLCTLKHTKADLERNVNEFTLCVQRHL